jgi:AcrR family transcriptional regulator
MARADHTEILAAARRAFTAHGYAGATIERIADEAGVSRVTLHRRGVTKDGLLGELVEAATEDYRRSLWPALTGDGPAASRLGEALGALCVAADEHLGMLRALNARADRVFHEEGDEVLTRTVFTEPLERLLRDGAADGSLRAVDDPRETATVLFNLVGQTYLHLRTGHGWTADRARRATLDLALNGVVA